MARKRVHHRRHSTALAPYRAPARPIIIREGGRSGGHRKHHRSRGRQSSEKVLIGMALGGFIMGFLDKPGGPASNLPTIPILGKAGTIAVAAHFFGKGKPGIITDVRNAAAAVAGYEFGTKGSVSGDEV